MDKEVVILVEKVVENILKIIWYFYDLGGIEYYSIVSIGISFFGDYEISIEEFFKCVDMVMY